MIMIYQPSIQANGADPDQMPQNAASDKGLHCLLFDMNFYQK